MEDPIPTDNPDRFFQFDPSTRIRYRLEGSGDHTLILLHGFGASLDSWEAVTRLLESTFRIIRLDFRGFGGSSRARDHCYSLDFQAGIVEALADHLDVRRYSLVGHSYGGTIALVLHEHLRSTGALGMLVSLALVDTPSNSRVLPFFIRLLKDPLLGRLVMALPAMLRAQFTLARLFKDRTKISPETLRSYAKYYAIPGSSNSFREAAASAAPSNEAALFEGLRQIQVRTLILWGDCDPIIPLSEGVQLHRHIRGSKFIAIPNCGHIPQEEAPEAVVAALKNFLR